MFRLTAKDLKTAPLSLLEALALSLARDIDRGATELREELESVMALVPNAPVLA